MKAFATSSVAFLALMSSLAGPVAAKSTTHCGAELLKGRYVFAASGFTRAPNSGPGTPWVPKAILQVIEFNGDGSLSTPTITVANPFGDTGTLLAPPIGGAPGAYIVNEDCTGLIHFFDAVGVMYNIYVEQGGDTVKMIQSNPAQNVSQGTAQRVK